MGANNSSLKWVHPVLDIQEIMADLEVVMGSLRPIDFLAQQKL